MGQPIYFTGQNPQSLNVVNGLIPNNNWIDVTHESGSLDSLSLTWTEQRDYNGNNTPGITFSRRSSSGNIPIEGNAYRLIKQWLIFDVAATRNSIEVKIEHVGCATYQNWQIDRGQVTFCESDEICSIDTTLKQVDDFYHCIQKTQIADNWQGWFQKIPAGSKKHPRFSYCNEQRPNGWLIMVLFLLTTGYGTNALATFIFNLTVITIAATINFIIDAVNALGGSLNRITMPSIGQQFKTFAVIVVETIGCGREHPAPLIRDYIKNVCDKCGIKVDATTAPIFFSQNITLQASSGAKNNVHNPYYNACYLNAPTRRGIRRYKNMNLITGFESMNNDEFYIPENSPEWSLSDYLDIIQKPFNAEWRIKLVNGSPYLYFWRKDWFIDASPILDFTKGAKDRDKILEGICFNPIEVTYPAVVDGLYAFDPVDTCGNDFLRRYNGEAYSFNENEEDKAYNGVLSSQSDKLSCANFRLSGDNDYAYDAIQICLNLETFSFLTFMPGTTEFSNRAWEEAMRQIRRFADHGLLLRDETATFGKIIIWDQGSGYTNAKAVRSKSIIPGTYPLPQPAPNIKYNSERWVEKYDLDRPLVRGENALWNSFSSENGKYKIKWFSSPLSGFVGTRTILSDEAAIIKNWPMYFNPGYEDTLWDWFWWIDDPMLNPRLGLQWSVKLDLCCEYLSILGVENEARDIVLGQPVKIDLPYHQIGKITEITVNYNSEEEFGKHIEIMGTI